MAFVYDVSFRPSSEITANQPYLADDMNHLHKNIHRIMHKISGAPVVTSEGSLYLKLPTGIKRKRDGLKRNYDKIWDETIIYFDPAAYGASAHLKDLYITFGEFFTKPQQPLILEKVLWHEFLHLVIDLPKHMHHGQINHIIKHGLKLPGDPNPLGTVGLEC